MIRSRFGRAALLAACAVAAAAARAQPAAPFDWEAPPAADLAPGVRHAEAACDAPRAMRLHAVRVDLRTPGIGFTGSARCEAWAADGNEVRRETASDFVRARRAAGAPVVAAINANPFAPWPAPWNQPGLSNLVGLAVSDGKLVSPASGSPSFLYYEGGRAAIAATDAATPLEGVRAAVSGFEQCLVAGVPQAGNDSLAPRTGIGLSPDGQRVILMVIDGRRRASEGATTEELGAWMRHFGAHDAINLDGGGSTTLVQWKAGAAGNGSAVVLNRPVGDGVDWRVRSAAAEQRFARHAERFNGNHLGVTYTAAP